MATSNKKKGASSASNFKRASKGFEQELPSGNVVIMRVPGLPTLLSEGLLPDSLTSIIQSQINDRSGAKASNPGMDVSTPEELASMFDAFDKVFARCVVEPEVEFYRDSQGNSIPDEDRNDEIVYTDEVDLDDKIFVFNVVSGGTKDLEKFRSEFSAGMDDISDE